MAGTSVRVGCHPYAWCKYRRVARAGGTFHAYLLSTLIMVPIVKSANCRGEYHQSSYEPRNGA